MKMYEQYDTENRKNNNPIFQLNANYISKYFLPGATRDENLEKLITNSLNSTNWYPKHCLDLISGIDHSSHHTRNECSVGILED